MHPRAPLAEPCIRTSLERFLEEREATLPPDEIRLYRRVLVFLALCINNYGHRNLDAGERDLCEKHHRGLLGPRRLFFEIFGPEKLLVELDFFCSRFLLRDVHTSPRVVEQAPRVVEDLRRWLMASGLVSLRELDAAQARAGERARCATIARRIARSLDRCILSVDAASLESCDYVPEEHHLVVRAEPRKIWLRVYRTPEAEEIGPLLVPQEVSRWLRRGWSLRCALGRVRGRWHLVELSEILPGR